MPEIIPIKDLRQTILLSEKCHDYNGPIFVSKNGYADLVIMSNEYYDSVMKKSIHSSQNIKNTLNIEFFEDNLWDAVQGGIYGISLIFKGVKTLLYVGEANFMNKRCGEHLMNFRNDPKYFGFTEEQIKNKDITLRFKVIMRCSADKRIVKETDLIKVLQPVLQNGVKDDMFDVPTKCNIIEKLLSSVSF